MLGANFQVETVEEKNDYGRFVIEPLDTGYGQTLGNALRRVLLTSLPGAAVTSVKIAGAKHQFQTLPGLKEDVVELILNIKGLRIKYEGEKSAIITLSVKGPSKITAKAIECEAGVTVINKDHYLGALTDKNVKLEAEMTVERGYGYSLADERKIETVGVIPIDAAFSPVLRVNYRVESTRVGRVTDLDKLVFELWTNETVAPRKALDEASKILVNCFKQIYDPKPIITGKTDVLAGTNDPKSGIFEDPLQLSVDELDLPTRIANSLKNGGIDTVGDLVNIPKRELLKIKNLGGKSLSMVEEKLAVRNLKISDEL